MVEPDDWRLTGQEEFLCGQSLFHRAWQAPVPESDHSHCVFCWAKFSKFEGTLQEGYVTRDGRHWICPQCFRDFQAKFGWIVIEPSKLPEKGCFHEHFSL